ncbi:4Fe-4S binding protein [Streptomyces sp. NPDC051636]|uniref:4Fe-4S binding protein n=1 Tax=Streptomyces sp. NPDC051636 TaxID=3365663 RepID=UPI0037A1B717
MKGGLRSSFMGIPLKNPFVLASAPPTGSARGIGRSAASGWAGAVTKTLTRMPQYARNLTPSLLPARNLGWQRIGMLNNELRTPMTLAEWCASEIPRARQSAGADFCLGVSIMEGPSPRDWEISARDCSEAGASYLELNVSCPHGAPEKFRGTFIGDDPGLLGEVVRAACSGSAVPVAVKLNASSHCLVEAATAAIANGAGGLVCTNTLPGLPPFDHLLGRPEGVPVTPMGLSGSSLLPMNRLAVARLSGELGADVMAVGGVSGAADVIDYAMLGARAVQVATAVMSRGLKLITSLERNVTSRLAAAEDASFGSIVGSGLRWVTSASQCPDEWFTRTAEVDMMRCTLCRACVPVCAESAASCISVADDALKIDEDRCTGCGLCLMACPVDALHLRNLSDTEGFDV